MGAGNDKVDVVARNLADVEKKVDSVDGKVQLFKE